MNAENSGWDALDDDEATLAASGSTVDDIRAEAARIREQASPHVASDSGGELPEEPTIIRNFEQANELTLGAEDASPRFDPTVDPTTVMAEQSVDDAVAPELQVQPTPTPAAPFNQHVAQTAGQASLIDGKVPPPAGATYWENGQLAATVDPASQGKGPVPKWFIATSLLAVLMAVGLVLLVLWALSGSST